MSLEGGRREEGGGRRWEEGKRGKKGGYEGGWKGEERGRQGSVSVLLLDRKFAADHFLRDLLIN